MKFCQVILSNVYPSLPGLPSWLALIKWMKYIRYHILYHILYFTKYLVTTKLYMMVLRRYDNIFGADILHLESPCSLIRKEILTGCTAGNHFLRPPDNSMCFGNRSHRCFNRLAALESKSMGNYFNLDVLYVKLQNILQMYTNHLWMR